MNAYNAILNIDKYIGDTPSEKDKQDIDGFLSTICFTVKTIGGDKFAVFLKDQTSPLFARQRMPDEPGMPTSYIDTERKKPDAYSVKVITKSNGPFTFSGIKSWFVSEDGTLYLKRSDNERGCVFASGEWVGVYPVDAKE
jgi:hypothetical protein